MLRTSSTRLLDARDDADVRQLLSIDPVMDVFVASRVHAGGVTERSLGAQLWGYGPRGRLESLCYSGANLVPVQASPDAVRAFADRARRQGRRCSSIVGEAGVVEQLWHLLAPVWGSARDVRPDQPLLASHGQHTVQADHRVRRVRADELDVLLPACVAMFTEEVGISPTAGDGGRAYRRRVGELVKQGRSYAIVEDQKILFKAEIGAASRSVCQVQGVWVEPGLRGTGLGTAGMAAVVALARAEIAPVVSLYVNGFNTPARKAYERVGFHQVGTCASVLF